VINRGNHGETLIRVLLVDDQCLVRLAVRSLLSREPGIQVVAEAGHGAEALDKARQFKPDVALVDVDMPDVSGLEVTARMIALPQPPKVIVLSVHTRSPWPQRLLEAGAWGYVAKERSIAEIVEAVQTVYRGAYYFSPTLVGSLVVGRVGQDQDDPFQSLSNRQWEIMTLLIKGKSPEAIAELLHVSPKTIYTHRERVQKKLGVSNDVEMTHMAIRYGLLEIK
jgi:two-component system invasion response regulator UvrY